MWGIELGVMFFMILLNSVFAGYEIALASISQHRLERLVNAQTRGAASAVRMKTNIEASLAVVQLGITLVGVIAAATGGAGAEESIEPHFLKMGLSPTLAQVFAIAVVVAPLTVITIIFGELLPKVFSMRNNEWVCLRLSPLMELFSKCVWPIVWLLERPVTILMEIGENRFLKEDKNVGAIGDSALQELRALASIARTSRLIGIREENIIINAARLSSTTVRSIQLPAQYISMLYLGSSMTDCLIAAHEDMHTRFPVTDSLDDPQKIVGYVNFKDIVASLRISPHDASLRGILRPLPRLPDDLTVSHCLEKLIHERIHIALVMDTSGKVSGMITLEDILEELIGEIHDEYDRLPSHINRSGKGWIVGGNASLGLLKEVCKIELPIDASQKTPVTLNEWVATNLGKPVDGGEVIVLRNLRIVVRKVRRQQVLEASLLEANDGN